MKVHTSKDVDRTGTGIKQGEGNTNHIYTFFIHLFVWRLWMINKCDIMIYVFLFCATSLSTTHSDIQIFQRMPASDY